MKNQSHRSWLHLKWVFHPISMLVIAQLCWALLVAVWFYFYFFKVRELEALVQKIPVHSFFTPGTWFILVQGCVLLAVILLALYMVFLAFQRQYRLGKAREIFLSTVTHELKTPLASIRLSMETLLLRDLSSSDQKRFIRRSLNEAHRLQNLIDAILLSAQLEGQIQTEDFQSVDIVTLAQEAFLRAQERFPEDRYWVLDVPNEAAGFLIQGIPGQLAMIFDNLLSNAIKYTERAGLVKMSVHVKGQLITISILDDGLGIERKNLKKIFEKFHRVHHRKKISGTGLGLYVVTNIVRHHRGSIRVHSMGLGKGAQFDVSFKRAGSDR